MLAEQRALHGRTGLWAESEYQGSAITIVPLSIARYSIAETTTPQYAVNEVDDLEGT